MTEQDASGRMKAMMEEMLLEQLEEMKSGEKAMDMKVLAEVRQWVKAFPPEGAPDDFPVGREDPDLTNMIKKHKGKLPES